MNTETGVITPISLFANMQTWAEVASAVKAGERVMRCHESPKFPRCFQPALHLFHHKLPLPLSSAKGMVALSLIKVHSQSVRERPKVDREDTIQLLYR
jgi:hypothetical protein